MWWLLLVTISFFCPNIINTIASNPSNDSTLSIDNDTNVTEVPQRPPLIRADEVMHNHLLWGELWPTDGNNTDRFPRFYYLYGSCHQRKNTSYWRMVDFIEWKSIALQYIDLFNVWCQRPIARILEELFEEGLIHSGFGNSLTYRYDSQLMRKAEHSPGDHDKIRAMVEIVAFSQVYVSWHLFPIEPVDPNGKPLMQGCYIALVYRLHAIDLILDSSYWLVGRTSFDMSQRFKRTLQIIHYEWISHRGITTYWREKRQCFVVSMALYEWLMKEAKHMKANECAHDTFKEYLNQREHIYLEKANKYKKFSESDYDL